MGAQAVRAHLYHQMVFLRRAELHARHRKDGSRDGHLLIDGFHFSRRSGRVPLADAVDGNLVELRRYFRIVRDYGVDVHAALSQIPVESDAVDA